MWSIACNILKKELNELPPIMNDKELIEKIDDLNEKADEILLWLKSINNKEEKGE